MNVAIMRRLADLEKRFSQRETPSLILFSYDEAGREWAIVEQFAKLDGRGKITSGGKRIEKRVKNLAGYVVPAECNAQMIFDLTGRGEVEILTVHTGEIRQAAQIGKAAFAIRQIDPPEDHEGSSPAGDATIRIDVYGKDEAR